MRGDWAALAAILVVAVGITVGVVLLVVLSAVAVSWVGFETVAVALLAATALGVWL